MATKITTRVLADDAVTDAKIADVTLTTATQSASDNTTKIATTAYVTTAIANLADSAPSTLNTLNELAAALGDDANYATTTTNAIAAKAPLASPTFTTTITTPDINITGGSQIGQDYAYLKSNSTTTASLTLRKDSTGADSIDFLQLRADGNGLIGKIEGDGDISFKNATFSGTISSGDITSSKLHVYQSNASITPDADADDFIIEGNSATGMTIGSSNSSVGSIRFADSGSPRAGMIYYNHVGNEMRFYTGATERLRIDSAGNVGINNDSPSHRLHIQGNTNDLARVRVTNTSSGQASLDLNNTEGYFRTYTDGGEYRIYDQTDGTNRFIIDTSGKVGIGTTAPQTSTKGLHVVHDATEGTPSFPSGEVIIAQRNFNSSQGCHIGIIGGSASDSAINFGDKDNSDAGIIRYHHNGDFLGFTTNTTEHWKMFANGSFQPTQQHTKDIGGVNAEVRNIYAQGLYVGGSAAANKLDDYEEGTFTPALINGTYTYTYRRGHYVKIGNLVHIHIGFKLAGASPTAGLGTITGLPFTSTSYGSYQEPHTRIGAGGLLVTANLGSHLTFYKGNGNTSLFARTTSGNIDEPVASNLIWQAGTFIKFNMIYTTA